jgi:hypothetical protein
MKSGYFSTLPAVFVCLSLISAGAALTGCKSRQVGGVFIKRSAPAPKDKLAYTPKAESGPHIGDSRYQRVIRPLLHKYGCDSGACHGGFRGGGLYITRPDGRSLRDYQTLLERVDHEHPEKSELVLKALGKVPHNGGRNIDEKSCDMARLLAWIGNQPEPNCVDPPPPDLGARFAREVAPAVVMLGCADKACHGGGPSTKKLDLTGLVLSPPQTEPARLAIERYNGGLFTIWTTPLLHAADGNDGIHKPAVADPLSCAYRRFYGFLARAPELTCELSPTKPEPRPSLEVFSAQVLPVLERRGCTQSACHGTGAGGMTLVPGQPGQPMALHDYIMLTARVEDLNNVEASTLLRTARNLEPHGGGRRLGGKGDCVDTQITAWLKRQPINACPPPTPPSYERFVSEMQPTLDKMTCTNPKCHGGAIPTFNLIKYAKTAKDLMFNYREVLKQIDYDYAPISGIMLRMREVCAYSISLAWIEKTPKPSCVVHDPDPSIFPRRDGEGNIVHSQLATPPVHEE